MKMRWVWIPVLALCLGVAARDAQAVKPERFLDIGGTFVAESENSDDEETKIQRTVGWAKLKLPVPLKGGNALLFGLDYQSQWIGYDEAPTNELPNTLYSLGATLGFVWAMTENWSTVVQFMPGIQSDMEDVSSEDYVFKGSLLFVRPFGKANRFGIGAAFSDAFGSPQPIPLLLIDWYPAENWFVEGLLPTDLDVGYRFSKALSVGLEGKVRGYMYRMSDDEDTWDSAVLRYTEIQVGPFVDYSLTDKLHLRASAGVSAANKFEFRDDDNDDKLVEGDFKNSGYGTLNLYWTF